jgi:predicted RNA binding protein YcfA (HicA-like mRNA interferase family)
MTGAEFIRRMRALGRRRGVPVDLVAREGKGSHGRLYYGRLSTVVVDRKREIRKGLLNQMLKDLGLSRADLDEG